MKKINAFKIQNVCSADGSDLCQTCIYKKHNNYNKCLINFNVFYKVTSCFDYECFIKDQEDFK
jgi:hypothetical protein